MLPTQWHDPREVLPEEGVIVTTMDSAMFERELVWSGGLWWLPDMSMYVYFTPLYWKVRNEAT